MHHILEILLNKESNHRIILQVLRIGTIRTKLKIPTFDGMYVNSSLLFCHFREVDAAIEILNFLYMMLFLGD